MSDDEEWKNGVPPEGRHSRDRAKPGFAREREWRPSGGSPVQSSSSLT